MNVDGINSSQFTDATAVDRYRYVYQVVLEEQIGAAPTALPVSAQPYFENAPVDGAVLGSQINIFV